MAVVDSELCPRLFTVPFNLTHFTLFNLRVWLPSCTTSLQVLFGLPLGLFTVPHVAGHQR